MSFPSPIDIHRAQDEEQNAAPARDAMLKLMGSFGEATEAQEESPAVDTSNRSPVSRLDGGPEKTEMETFRQMVTRVFHEWKKDRLLQKAEASMQDQ